MKTLIVGAGALGGLIGARLRASGAPVWLAVRDADAAATLRRAGLEVTGIGKAVSVEAAPVAALDDYRDERFDLVVLATKAADAVAVAPRLAELLTPGGTLLPIQNGGVSQILGERLGDRVLGGLSNLGATMHAPGRYEQRNAGHILIGELAGGGSERTDRVRAFLGAAVEVRATPNLRGAVWSKLIVNCSVTTLGAVAGTTMRGYIATEAGRAVFDRAYDEALAVAIASGARPERMLVEPVPPDDRAPWIEEVLGAYGDLKPSMLGDFERGRPTEVAFINGYVVELGAKLGVPTPVNAAIVDTIAAISAGRLRPDMARILNIRATWQSKT